MSESILRGVCEEIAREIERTDAIAAAGNVRAIVDCRNGLKSIQKRKGLHGSTS